MGSCCTLWDMLLSTILCCLILYASETKAVVQPIQWPIEESDQSKQLYERELSYLYTFWSNFQFLFLTATYNNSM